MKIAFLNIVLLLAGGILCHAEDGKMTLDDRRFLESLKTEKLPDVEKKIEEAVGGKVAVEVDWKSFSTRESLNMLEYTLKELPAAFKETAHDEIGKKALQSQIAKVNIANSDNEDWAKTGTLKEKSFLIQWNFNKGSYINGSMIAKAFNKLL